MQFIELLADSKLTLKDAKELLSVCREESAKVGNVKLNACTMLPSTASVTICGLYPSVVDTKQCDIFVYVEHSNKLGIYRITYDLSLDVILKPLADEINCLGNSAFQYTDADSGDAHIVLVKDAPQDYLIDECVTIGVRDDDGNPYDMYIYRNKGVFVACVTSRLTEFRAVSHIIEGQALLDVLHGLLFSYQGVYRKHKKRDILAEDSIKLIKQTLEQLGDDCYC
jgi:hypothetical protein